MNTFRRSLIKTLVLAPGVLINSRVFSAAQTLSSPDAKTTIALNPIKSYGEVVRYSIYRKNKKIGEHTLRFSTGADQLQVDIESNILVTVFKVPFYRFNYRATENWIDGRLMSVKAATNDNGDKSQVSAIRSGDQMVVTDKAGNTFNDDVAHSSNHWNNQVLNANSLFNTLTGKVNQVIVENLGSEQLMINAQATQAHHYRLAGDLKTDVWYDNQGRWVKLSFKSKDGSLIEYRCEGFTL